VKYCFAFKTPLTMQVLLQTSSTAYVKTAPLSFLGESCFPWQYSQIFTIKTLHEGLLISFPWFLVH